jgi:hypothetical protein
MGNNKESLMFENPQWVATSLRQMAASLGIILATLDLVEATVWDQLAPAVVSIILIFYDIWRTREMEVEMKDLQKSNHLWALVSRGAADSNTAEQIDAEMST